MLRQNPIIAGERVGVHTVLTPRLLRKYTLG